MRIFRIRFWTQEFLFVMRSRKAGLAFATWARKQELCLQSYVSRMTLTENFPSQHFSKFFWKLWTFVHVSCYPDHYEPKIFFSVFWSPYLHSEGCGCDRLELRIENNSDWTFSKSKIFKLFLETTFVHVSCYPNHYEQKIFFRFSKSGLEGSP